MATLSKVKFGDGVASIVTRNLSEGEVLALAAAGASRKFVADHWDKRRGGSNAAAVAERIKLLAAEKVDLGWLAKGKGKAAQAASTILRLLPSAAASQYHLVSALDGRIPTVGRGDPSGKTTLSHGGPELVDALQALAEHLKTAAYPVQDHRSRYPAKPDTGAKAPTTKAAAAPKPAAPKPAARKRKPVTEQAPITEQAPAAPEQAAGGEESAA